MHYVTHGQEPEILKKYRDGYTRKWMDHYPNRQGKKPNDNYWTTDEIREPLIQCFEDNCGYCGVGMGRRHSKSGKMIPVGTVDHFLPKSECPQYVYCWENYIWCCMDCNRTKGEYYDPGCMLFDPCNEEDTQVLELRRDGKYYLREEFSDDELLQQRYRITCMKTLMNAGIRPKERSARKNELEILLSELRRTWELSQSGILENFPSEAKALILEGFQKSISLLKQILDGQSDRKMIRSIFEQMLSKEPDLRDILEKPGFALSGQTTLMERIS